MIKLRFTCLMISFCMLCACTTQPPDAPTQQLSDKKYVRGFLAVKIPSRKDQNDIGHNNDIYIPGVKVTLENTSTGDIAKVITDLSGRFSFPPQQTDSYKLCWELDGYKSDCHPTPIQVNTRPYNIGTLYISPNADFETRVLVYGSIKMRDEQFNRELEPMVGINSFAKVEAIDSSNNLVHQTAVNNQGKYVLPDVPNNDKLISITASVENEKMTIKRVKETLQGAGRHRIDISLRNHVPRILDVVSRVGGKQVEYAQAGDLVSLSVAAQDVDGDSLKYQWYINNNGGTLSAPNSTNTNWQLPAQKGRYIATVHVSDGHGGYAVGKASLAVGLDKATFSGRVVDSNGAPIANADIEIGNTSDTANTNAEGYFTLKTKLAGRYVLNIRKANFAIVSNIYRRSHQNGHWTMHASTVVNADPTTDIVVIDNPTQKERCFVPAYERVNWKNFPNVQNRRKQDGKGRTFAVEEKIRSDFYPAKLIRQRKEGQCGLGAELHIPANSLVDKDGNAPPGPVTIELNTVDLLAPDSMPGDYSVDDGSFMISYGASIVEISAGGVKYNYLAEGTTALLRIPVSDVQIAAGGPIPATIPKFIYDEPTGLWGKEDTFTLDATGQYYEAAMTHFSPINTDIQKSGQSCVRFRSENMPLPYNLDVIVPIPNAAPVQRTGQFNSNGVYELIINLPNDTEITLMAYDIVDDQVVPHGVYTVNTNGPQTGNPSAPNFSECQTKVVLEPVTMPEPGPDAFLHGLYSFQATKVQENDLSIPDPALKDELEDATIAYYNTVDPRGRRNNFDKFKQVNNFVANGATTLKSSYGPGDEIRAAYANAIDLGFGRDMHGKRTLADDGQWDIAFYVTNYGDYTTDDTTDQEQAVGQDPAQVIATVAMEWSRIEDGPANDFDYYDPENTDPDPNDPNAPIVYSDNDRVIKFYVYGNDGNPVFAANLDTRGARPIPQLCMVCHGGAYDDGFNTGTPAFSDPADVKMGAVMLPFDIHGYVFSGSAPANFSKSEQQLELFELNKMVVDTQPGIVIDEIIDEMYSPINPAGAEVQIEDFVVTGWSANGAHEDMYLNVVKPACRVCHASRPLEDTDGGIRDLRMHDVNQFTVAAPVGIAGKASEKVCITREMPHAFATYNRYWYSYNPLSPIEGVLFQPSRLQAFFDGVVEPVLGGELGNQCVTTPPADESVIEEPAKLSELQVNLFDGFGCSSSACHDAGGTGGINMDLTDGNTRGSTRNVNAQESSNNLDRIEPNNHIASFLYKKMSSDNPVLSSECNDVSSDCTAPMPFGAASGLPDSNATMEDLIEWINNNAPND